jgi:hypothetical protein
MPVRQNAGMEQKQIKYGRCPKCGERLELVPSLFGKETRRLRCENCEQPDPMKQGVASGWIRGELQPPK